MKLKPIWLSALGVVAVCAVYYMLPRGVTVTVINVGVRPLRGAVIYVSGGSYALGDIAPGEKRFARVRPTRESHVELSYLGPTGESRRMNLGGYIEENHYLGSMTAPVNADWEKPVEVNGKIRIVPW